MGKTGSAEIASILRKDIEKGVYARFERLPPSRELAERYNVARNTLRDALYRLEKEGLVETRPGSGTYCIFDPSDRFPGALIEATPLEMIDARFALEPHICRLAVLNGRREDFDNLERLCDQMEHSKTDPISFAEADSEYHHTLAKSTRNNLLMWLLGHISTMRSLDEWTRMRHLTLDHKIIERYNTQHRAILAAIRAREPERAAMAMKDHLETARLSLTRVADT